MGDVKVRVLQGPSKTVTEVIKTCEVGGTKSGAHEVSGVLTCRRVDW